MLLAKSSKKLDNSTRDEKFEICSDGCLNLWEVKKYLRDKSNLVKSILKNFMENPDSFKKILYRLLPERKIIALTLALVLGSPKEIGIGSDKNPKDQQFQQETISPVKLESANTKLSLRLTLDFR